MEEMLQFTEGFTAVEIERFIEALGRNRTFAVEEARRAADAIQASVEGGLPVYERRQELAKAMAQRGLVLEDPGRRALLEDLAARTEGYVGSDIEALCREAGMFALRERTPVITGEHFEKALAKVHPTMNENLRSYYQRIQQHFKGGLPREAQPPEYQ